MSVSNAEEAEEHVTIHFVLQNVFPIFSDIGDKKINEFMKENNIPMEVVPACLADVSMDRMSSLASFFNTKKFEKMRLYDPSLKLLNEARVFQMEIQFWLNRILEAVGKHYCSRRH